MHTDYIDGIEGLAEYIETIAHDFAVMDLEPFGKSELQVLQETEAGYFDNAVDPTGRAWPDIEESTKKRKGHGRILIDSTRLITSLTESSGEDAIRDVAVLSDATEIIYGTSTPYSRYLEQPNSLGKVWPHIGVSETWIDGCCVRLVDFALGQLK